jgi:hypothetical protein
LTASLSRRGFQLGLASLALPSGGRAAGLARPTGLAGGFETLADWRFGTQRPDATMRSMTDLRRDFRFRYIYDDGKLDGLPTYWSKHRDYPEGDPRSLHVFGPDQLALKGRIPPGGGLRPGGIESGMLRALLPVTPGMVIEMRAKLPRGLGTWPAFWLNPGVEGKDGRMSKLPWPPEIDIFEFFVWQGRTRPRLMESHVQTAGRPQDFGDPHDLFTKFGRDGFDPGFDFSADWHIFGLDWQEGRPVWLLDGQAIKQTVYRWSAPPAHILVTNQIGMSLAGTDMSGMKAGGDDWDYCLDYLRVFRRL